MKLKIQASFQFHIMRDLPLHTTPMLGGLWGANNYMNISKTEIMRTELFNMVPDGRYGADQNTLVNKVWPVARFNSEPFILASYSDLKAISLHP